MIQPNRPSASPETINQIADRFCASFASCNECPYGVGRELGVDHCLIKQLSMITYPFETITDFLKKWASEHPPVKQKTYADDFFEKFPSAERTRHSCGAVIPTICRKALYDNNLFAIFGCSQNCKACWLKPMPNNNGGENQ